MPCTTILIGKKATFDGSTMMARNEDSGAGKFCSKKFIVVNPKDQPTNYKSVISGVKIKLPDHPMRYTAMPNANPKEGIWGEAGVNELNVAMSETETLTSNSRVLGADPLVKTGIGEEDLLTITLPYIKSAREGVIRLGKLHEKYGTYEMNGIGFQDEKEIWWFETVGGHHFIAKRVPDDAYVVVPNQLGINFFDFADAFGKKENHICSSDMIDFIMKNHLNLMQESAEDLKKETAFDIRAAFGSHTESDHCYNTPRAWYMLKCLNPNTFKWEGEDADYTPESDDLPWSLVPEKKVTVEDVKYVLSSYYQGTKYNPYGKRGENSEAGKYRPIGINRNNFVALTQIRSDLPEKIKAIEWIAEASNAFNAFVPFYTQVSKTPEYLANTTDTVSTENFYWVNRIIGTLADAHYNTCLPWIERYQLAMASKGNQMIREFDEAYIKDDELSLEECNEKLAAMAKELTDNLLDKVLYFSSGEMKNAFSRNDY